MYFVSEFRIQLGYFRDGRGMHLPGRRIPWCSRISSYYSGGHRVRSATPRNLDFRTRNTLVSTCPALDLLKDALPTFFHKIGLSLLRKTLWGPITEQLSIITDLAALFYWKLFLRPSDHNSKQLPFCLSLYRLIRTIAYNMPYKEHKLEKRLNFSIFVSLIIFKRFKDETNRME